MTVDSDKCSNISPNNHNYTTVTVITSVTVTMTKSVTKSVTMTALREHLGFVITALDLCTCVLPNCVVLCCIAFS